MNPSRPYPREGDVYVPEHEPLVREVLAEVEHLEIGPDPGGEEVLP